MDSIMDDLIIAPNQISKQTENKCKEQRIEQIKRNTSAYLASLKDADFMKIAQKLIEKSQTS